MSTTPVRYFEASEIRSFRSVGAIHPRIQVNSEYVILSAVLKRVFPMSNPSIYVSIQDGSGKEIGILRSLQGLDEQTSKIIEEELDRRYFTPHVIEINELRMEAGMWRFDVQTQRGSTRFFVRNWRDSAQEITPGRWQIMSVDGARFEILDLTRLDAKSQRLLDQLL